MWSNFKKFDLGQTQNDLFFGTEGVSYNGYIWLEAPDQLSNMAWQKLQQMKQKMT